MARHAAEEAVTAVALSRRGIDGGDEHDAARLDIAIEREAGQRDVVQRLGVLCSDRGPLRVADRLRALAELSREDLLAVDAALAELPRGRTLVTRGATHLLALGGKRLRPLCVALAARVGSGFSAAARELAVAAELVHSATLLHDDVVDLGETRRGAPTARALYGNAASIFAGDWLLTEALRRVTAARVPGTLEALLGAIQEMILAESTQLENRGRIVADRGVYLDVAAGKTGALFRWALDAGARAGGLPDEQRLALGRYGLHLGIAFQAVDDLLDLTGSPATTGKSLFSDVREGKMTWPLILALEREPALKALLEEIIALPVDGAAPDSLVSSIVNAVARTGAAEDCRRFAHGRADAAVACLAALPESAVRDALATVTAAAVDRRS